MSERTDSKAQMKVRVPDQTRQRLESAAEANGWTLNREIVQRIEKSLNDDDMLGGPRTAGYIRVLVATIQAIEGERGTAWTEDADTWRVVMTATSELTRSYRPAAADQEVEEFDALRDRVRKAEEALAQVRGPVDQRYLNADPLSRAVLDQLSSTGGAILGTPTPEQEAKLAEIKAAEDELLEARQALNEAEIPRNARHHELRAFGLEKARAAAPDREF